MPDRHDRRYRYMSRFQKYVYNRVLGRFPMQPVLETRGRKSGLPRRVPVSGRRAGDDVWFVSEFGDRSDYVRNIEADPRVRVRLRDGWHTGTARLLPDDDAHRRLRQLARFPALAIRAVGTNLLTVCVHLDAVPACSPSPTGPNAEAAEAN
jgi:deazaflavin-dependent oxidoreductase (nitroreductase family)